MGVLGGENMSKSRLWRLGYRSVDRAWLACIDI